MEEPSASDSQSTGQPLETHSTLTANGIVWCKSQLGSLPSQGLRLIREYRQDDGLLHLQFGVQVNTVAIPYEGLQSAEGLTGFGDPLGNLVIASRVARNRAF
ncbi:unnamed protein product [Schistocephalus solidus]|uniref:Gamma-glutamyltranspeptidase n=1 Tax=Schistocephalus solidus TaxID=70667 RepID=A0A183SD25_SCHSO|nr:unnamed protein product [Schistocephalus solidus]